MFPAAQNLYVLPAISTGTSGQAGTLGSCSLAQQSSHQPLQKPLMPSLNCTASFHLCSPFHKHLPTGIFRDEHSQIGRNERKYREEEDAQSWLGGNGRAGGCKEALCPQGRRCSTEILMLHRGRDDML